MKKFMSLMAILLVTVVACEKTPMPQAPEIGPEPGLNVPEIAGKWQVLTVKEEYFAPRGDEWVLEDDAMSDYVDMAIDVWAHFLPGDRMVWEVDDELMREKIRVYDYKMVKRPVGGDGAAGTKGDPEAGESLFIESRALGNVVMEIVEMGGGRMVIQTTEVQEHSSMGPQKIVQRVECKRATAADLPDTERDLAGDWTQAFAVMTQAYIAPDRDELLDYGKEYRDEDPKNLRTFEDGTLAYFYMNQTERHVELYDEMVKVADNYWTFHTSWIEEQDGMDYHEYFTMHMLAKDEVLVLFHHEKRGGAMTEHKEEAILFKRHKLDKEFADVLEQTNVLPTCLMQLLGVVTRTYECNGAYWKRVKIEESSAPLVVENGFELEYNLCANKKGCEMLVKNDENGEIIQTMQRDFFTWELDRTTIRSKGWDGKVKEMKMSDAIQAAHFHYDDTGMMHVFESREEINGKMVVTSWLFNSHHMFKTPNQIGIIPDLDLIKKNLTEPEFWYAPEETQEEIMVKYNFIYNEGSNTDGILRITEDGGYQLEDEFEVRGDGLYFPDEVLEPRFFIITSILHNEMGIVDKELGKSAGLCAHYPKERK